MTQAIRFLTLVVAMAVAGVTAGTAQAQQVWVQIEAQPNLREAEQRARAYSGTFPNVSGFAMTTGWYAIALGPFAPVEAERQLAVLKDERLIPRDSFIETGDGFSRQFWPVGARIGALNPTPAPETVAPGIEPRAALPQSAPPDPVLDETPREARASEQRLSREERMELQQAMKWQGFYAAAIDGSFGGGTRRSMADWQSARGFEPTGILTTLQRSTLLDSYRNDIAELGLRRVVDEKAGIAIDLPMNLVTFSRYETPFVHYETKNDSGLRVLLISQNGDQTTLNGLYDVMQTLEIVPLEGERNIDRTSFRLTGRNATRGSYTQAALADGRIKGFTLVWSPKEAERAAKVLEIMKAGFAPLGDAALADDIAAQSDEQRTDMLSGLDIRRPALSRSGFYLDSAGTVLTTTEVLQDCQRITLDQTYEAELAYRDDALGIAVLKPLDTLSPPDHAAFRTALPRLNAEVAVAGYSYEDVLDTPVLTYGTLADLKSLTGDPAQVRLSLAALAGDTGGPVLDATGSVIGMLLPRQAENGKVLPADVGHALDAAAIAQALTEADMTPQASDRDALLSEPQLAGLAQSMTVLVSCWN